MKFLASNRAAIKNRSAFGCTLQHVIKPSDKMNGFFEGDAFDVFSTISKYVTSESSSPIESHPTIYFYIIIRDIHTKEYLVLHTDDNNRRFIGGPIFEPRKLGLCPNKISQWDELDLLNQAYESALAGLCEVTDCPYYEPMFTAMATPTWGVDDFNKWSGWKTIIGHPYVSNIPKLFGTTDPIVDPIYIPSADVSAIISPDTCSIMDLSGSIIQPAFRLIRIMDIPLMDALQYQSCKKDVTINVFNSAMRFRLGRMSNAITIDSDRYRYITNDADLQLADDLLHV